MLQKLSKWLQRKIQKNIKTQNSNADNPYQQQVSDLLDHYKSGRFGDAQKLAVTITQEFPNHELAWNVLGVLLKRTGRLTESLAACEKSVQLSPKDAYAHNNLGTTLQALGRRDEAMGRYSNAIALDPDFSEAHSNFGVMLAERGKLDEARLSYIQAIALKPDNFLAHNNLGNTLKELGRLSEALVVYNQAIALRPGYAEAHSNLGQTLQALGRIDDAEACFIQAVSLKPDYAKAHNSLLTCFFLLNKQSLFFEKLTYLINEGSVNSVIGSLTCRSALRYGVVKKNLFCSEPLKYVVHVDMRTRYEFEKIFVEQARLFLSDKRISNRDQSLLVNGYQTAGNLFDLGSNSIESIEKIIRMEVEKYRIKFLDSQEGLIKKWPTEYILNGWFISMKSGGKLKPHIHNDGWLSGSLYINIPPKTKADSGNLVVSIGKETDSTDTRINLEKKINVVTGSLVLFPASLMHHTIPFDSVEERIVLAFDVKPK
tara:strand:+ start:1035 stop:2489 length:1455 start_codon:yes stop_codon:yes gene_type:complete